MAAHTQHASKLYSLLTARGVGPVLLPAGLKSSSSPSSPLLPPRVSGLDASPVPPTTGAAALGCAAAWLLLALLSARLRSLLFYY